VTIAYYQTDELFWVGTITAVKTFTCVILTDMTLDPMKKERKTLF
jgi:hypothetical protein